MESRKRLFIVSFGDSEKYRLEFEDNSTNPYVHPYPLAPVERELDEYLSGIFPDETFAYYTTPRVMEVSWDHRDRYESYPELDARAVEQIKKVLRIEIEDENSLRKLNSNAPFSDIDSNAV